VSVEPAARAPSAASCQPSGVEEPGRPPLAVRSFSGGLDVRDRSNQLGDGASRSVVRGERREHGRGPGRAATDHRAPPAGGQAVPSGDPNRACTCGCEACNLKR
jgi:hypothetical protein